MTSLDVKNNGRGADVAIDQSSFCKLTTGNITPPVVSYLVGVKQGIIDEIRGHKITVLGLLRSRTEMAFEIGKHLNLVKGLLPHGQFEQWLKGELGGLRSAQRYMKIAKCFDGEFEHVKILSKDVLNDLSCKRSSSEVRRQVIDFCKGRTTDHSSEANAFAKGLLAQETKTNVFARKQHCEPESYSDTSVRDLAALVMDDISDRPNRFINILRTLGLPRLASQVADVVTTHPLGSVGD